MATALPLNLTCSFKDADLDSASSTRTPNYVFVDYKDYDTPIYILRCSNAFSTCLHIKDWILQSLRQSHLAEDGIMRMETQDLHLIDPAKGKHSELFLCEGMAFVDGKRDDDHRVSIMVVRIRGDNKLRWFNVVLPVAPLLQRLHDHRLCTLLGLCKPGSYTHRRYFVTFRELFTQTFTMPHSQDYDNAYTLTDCCPDIIDPDTALQRLEQNEQIYLSHKNVENSGRDLSDDRYLLHLHPAEREAASIARLKCAEYMLVKKNFFKAFFEDIYRSDKKIDQDASATRVEDESAPVTPARSRRHSRETPQRYETPASLADTDTPVPSTMGSARRGGGNRLGWRSRVRTEHAHRTWLEKEYEFSNTRAKMLIIAWRELGFLDEGRYLHWVREGGMLESIGLNGRKDDPNGVHAEEEIENADY